MPAISAVIGCWVFDVGCWMFPGFNGLGVTEAMALGYAPTPKPLMQVTSSWLEGGSRANSEPAAVLEAVWAHLRVPECQNAYAGGDLT